jgi:hypothetical protein
MLDTLKETIARSQIKILREQPDKVAGHAKLKKIPLLRYLDALSEEGTGLKQLFLIKKIGVFLETIQGVKAKVREGFTKRVQGSVFGESLAFALHQLDRVEKAGMLGKLVVAFMEEDLEEPEFWRYAHLLQHLAYEDLLALEKLEAEGGYDSKDHLAYVQSGLLVMDPKVVYEQEVAHNLGIEHRYHVSHHGLMLQQLLVGKKPLDATKVEKPVKKVKPLKTKPVKEVVPPIDPLPATETVEPALPESPKTEE